MPAGMFEGVDPSPPVLPGAGFVLVPSDGAEYCTASDVGDTVSAAAAPCAATAASAAASAAFRTVLNLLKCILQ